MAQQVKALTAKSDSLSSIPPEPHPIHRMEEERELGVEGENSVSNT